ncbi:hypothetical protein PF005_g4451 [Phytophthora fragariae]|uniref:Lebercilin domain-containing protein n=1 Tax=Phytophthora fragariae TaxID=53985 RepID=A0A6A3FI66_9STRA|nr:hypothetical protein PF003_g15966 [Phytophthora fragariae]KAE8945515.1 hypothetical protein PF009_g4838 [Phytophthora fragariae]KAE9023694.1 hypothetical protein PF011_g3861 [Phytophthora fragariae]KAE9130480.1 hypothetical protein PF010_g3830 [Phytophthora fragariae]KAE9130507.1 hypothetical protein PF007_g4487 [Phytophthora fragariae]
MENNASSDEYEDDLEAEEEVEVRPEVGDGQEQRDVHPDGTCDPVDSTIEVADRDLDVVVANEGEDLAAEDTSLERNDVLAEVRRIEELKVERDIANGLVGGGATSPEQLSEAEPELPTPPLEEPQKPRRSPKTRSGPADSKDLQISLLTKKLSQAKKVNAELHNQLQRFYTSEVVIQLENRVKEKEKQIEELIRENRTLKNSERLLAKQLEDLQNSKDNFPSKRRALQEELRVCKERIRQLKEQYRVADEKGFKLHQQSFDLAVKNKGLSEKVRLLEGATASTSLLSPAWSSARIGAALPIEGTSPEEVQTIIASQEEEITRLHQRVALMKKSHKADQVKYERLLKTSQDEIDRTRVEFEEFYQQLFAKERAARNQFLHMKKLKRALHELANTQQTNQRFQPFLANREMRLTNRSNGSRPNQAGQHSPQNGPASNPGRWIHEALHHLGFVMPLSSELDGSTRSVTGEAPEDQVDIPENCIQGKLVPFPPPTTIERGFATISSFGPRRGNRARNNANLSDVSEQATADNSDEGDPDMAETHASAPPTPETADLALYWEDSKEI